MPATAEAGVTELVVMYLIVFISSTAMYTSLDEQAKALGLHRATVWTIRENKHKLGRLSAKTNERIITNPETPPRVRAAVKEYAAEMAD